jgi:hypothetical protein
MNWKNLLESVSESVNDELRLRHDYLFAENRILRNQIDGRVQLTDRECQELAEMGRLGQNDRTIRITLISLRHPTTFS